MDVDGHSAHDPHLRLVAVSFAVNGLLYGGLLSRYADLAGAVGAGEAAFGLALTAGAVGGLVGSLVAPLLMRRAGYTIALVAAGCAYAALAAGVAASTGVVLLGAGLLLVGVADGGHDVAMNALAVKVQQRRGSSVMGRVHALWSLSLAAGAGLGAVAAAAGTPVVAHVTGVAALAGAAQLAAGIGTRREAAPGPAEPSTSPTPRPSPPRPTADTGGEDGRSWRSPQARVLLLAVVTAAAAASYVEGPGQDWSALLLARGLGADAGTAASAPLAFSVGLLCARFALDPLTTRLSRSVIATCAAAVTVVGAGAGALLAFTGGSAWVALALLFVVGLGAGPAYPMLFGAADVLAARHGISAAATASVISTSSRVGAISAPAAVGALASGVGLPIVFAVMATGGLLLLFALPRALR